MIARTKNTIETASNSERPILIGISCPVKRLWKASAVKASAKQMADIAKNTSARGGTSVSTTNAPFCAFFFKNGGWTPCKAGKRMHEHTKDRSGRRAPKSSRCAGHRTKPKPSRFGRAYACLDLALLRTHSDGSTPIPFGRAPRGPVAG
jgi:hypothetical protein